MGPYGSYPNRPAAVTVAAWLVCGVVAVLLIEIVLAVVEAVHFAGVIDRTAELTDATSGEVDGERFGNVMGLLFTGGPALLFAIWLAVCVPPLLRGRNAARILTMIPAGLTLLMCCVPAMFGSILALFLLASPVLDEPTASGPWPESDPDYPDYPADPDFSGYEESEFYEVLYSDTDPVFDALSVVTPLLVLLAFGLTVAATVLLLTPPANRFFRPQHQPPPSWPGYGTGYAYPVPVPVPVPVFGSFGQPFQQPPADLKVGDCPITTEGPAAPEAAAGVPEGCAGLLPSAPEQGREG